MAQAQPEDFRIDISHEQSFRYLQAKQFDHNSRTRRLIITDNNIPLTFTGKELIDLSLYINGENYSNTRCRFGEDGFPYVTFTESMLAYDGDVSGEIRIYNSSEAAVATTFTFKMTVSRSLLNQDRLVASSEFNILNDLILQANTIPDLIKEFGISQEQIHEFIENIRADIASYTEQFSNMKTQYTNDFNTMLQQINSDITSYQSDYNSLKSDIITLQSDVTSWYISAEEAENTRSTNETKRQHDTAEAIVHCEQVVVKAAAAAEEAENAAASAVSSANEALTQAVYAREQGERVDAAIEGLEQALIDVDGGNAFTLGSDYEDDYDGGEA